MNTLDHCFLYGIVDLGYVQPEAVDNVTQQLVRGGIDLLQLRAKDKPLDIIRQLAERMLRITQPANVPLIINDHPELLREVNAEGCHVGQTDYPVAQARELAGRLIIVGKSTHSVEQALAGEAEGADYIGFGPIFPTPTKPDAPAIGLGDLKKLRGKIKIPVFCIGGIKETNFTEVTDAGGERVCIVSDLLLAPDINARTRAIKAFL
ncbi:MAG TPA: thiamine phosphate synthase [Chthoniobacterales bacterium]|nr:thiamine phosphate synthase [Chthoniobacterales bacterium]